MQPYVALYKSSGRPSKESPTPSPSPWRWGGARGGAFSEPLDASEDLYLAALKLGGHNARRVKIPEGSKLDC
jgi:hypothetical protein